MNRLVEDFPERARYQEMRAIVAFNLGNLYFNQKELELAESAYRVAMEACDQLLDWFPDRKVFWDVSARASNGVGLSLRKRGKLEESEQAYLKSLTQWREFERLFGSTAASTSSKAITIGGMSQLMWTQDRREEAITWSRESIELKQKLVDQFPKQPYNKKSLSLQYGNLAEYQFEMGKITQALENFRQAFAIAKDLFDSHPDYRGQMYNLNRQLTGVAYTLAVLGNHDEAESTIDQQAELLPDDPDQIKVAVVSLGSIAKQLNESTEIDNETKSDLMQNYVGQARLLMTRAADLGADTSGWLDHDPANVLHVDGP